MSFFKPSVLSLAISKSALIEKNSAVRAKHFPNNCSLYKRGRIFKNIYTNTLYHKPPNSTQLLYNTMPHPVCKWAKVEAISNKPAKATIVARCPYNEM